MARLFEALGLTMPDGFAGATAAAALRDPHGDALATWTAERAKVARR
jgi:hypothetical protein